ncbi:O-antigen ligase family protein [Butyrivibrio sp. AE3006]|uniref:O-antigen ligase family protein n=1 Tax=Butyrivibrio sp. AE3006 TaxID=1280673 RepID=UPI0003FA61EE|nr:O-antigen ligase family protein [Butyrivibrio sp. AE3006]
MVFEINDKLVSRFITILLFHVSFVVVRIGNYNLFQNVLVAIIAIYLIMNYKFLLKSEYLVLNGIVALLAVEMFIPMLVNRDILDVSVRYAGVVVATFIVPFYVLECEKVKGNILEVIRTLYICGAFYCIISDITGIMTGAKYVGIGNYLVGNKFNLSYLHILTLVLFLYINSIKPQAKVVILFHVILTIAICIYSECSTAVVGVIVLLSMYEFKDSIIQILKRYTVFLIMLFVASTILILFSNIIYYEPIKYIIVEVLHEDMTLSGRMTGFQGILPAIMYKPVFGVGYSNNYVAAMLFTGGMADLQNGLADILLSFGIVGTVLILIIVYIAFKNTNEKQCAGFLFMAYMYVILSSVEVTLNLKFLVVIALLMFGFDDSIQQNIYKKEPKSIFYFERKGKK